MPVRLVRCERAAVRVAKRQVLAIAAMRAEDSHGLILQFNLSRPVPQLPEAKARQSERNHRSPSGLSHLDQSCRVVVRQRRTNPRLGPVLPRESRELGDDTLLGAEREHLPQARQKVVHRLVSAFASFGALLCCDVRVAWGDRATAHVRWDIGIV
jgi:hypothetical protein